MTVIELSQVLGNFGEFFGAIAVVGTLVYLAIEVRRSRMATLASAELARAELSIRSLLADRDSAYMAE